MRKVVATELMTLDEVMEAPEKWSGQFFNEEAAKFQHGERSLTMPFRWGDRPRR